MNVKLNFNIERATYYIIYTNITYYSRPQQIKSMVN